MSFALSARQLALGMDDEAGTVVLYDLDTGKESRFATGQGKKSSSSGYGVSAAAFSADGATLITAGRNSTIKVWDAITLKERHEIKDAYPGWIETLAVTRDGKRLACGGQGCMIRHFDVGSGVTVGGDDSHMGRVSDIAVTADGATAVTASADDHLRIWDVSTGRQQRAIRLELPESHWPKIALASDGRTVAVTVADKIKAWNVATGKAVPLPGQFADLKTANVRFAPNGKLAISLHADLVTLIEWPSGKLRRQFKLPEPVTKPGEASCDGAAISPDGRWLATVAHRSWYREERGLRYGYGGDGVLDLWNAATGERVHRLASGRATNRTVLFTADGDLLFVGGGDLQPLVGGSVALEGEFHLIDPLTGRLKQSFESAPRSPGASHRYNTALEISPDGRSIACAGNDGVIHVYEVATGKARRSLARHRAYVSGLAYTADGRRLLSASFDFTALAWDLSLTAIRPSSAQPPNVDQQTELWAALRSADAVAAYETMAALAAQPSLAVALIRRHIKPAAATPDDATLDRLAAALDDDTIVVREQATKELDGLGEAAVAGIRVRLAASPPPEARRRMLAFLEKHDPPTPPADRVREIRALEILEHLRDAESRGLLKELSQGARNARLTRMAATSLTRRQRLDSDPER
jgi:WD40 repeat protein